MRLRTAFAAVAGAPAVAAGAPAVGAPHTPYTDAAASRLGDRAAANRMVCRGLRLAAIRTGAGETWPKGAPYGNHAEVVSVDDAQGPCNLR